MWFNESTTEAGRASLYDASIRLLARRGFAIDTEAAERDPGAPYVHNASVEAAWAAICRDPQAHWDLYELAEKLVTVKKMDEAVQLQTEFAKSAYEDFVAGATKIGEIYTSMAKDVFKPFEAAARKMTPAE